MLQSAFQCVNVINDTDGIGVLYLQSLSIRIGNVAHFLGRFLGILASLCGTIAIVILFVLPVLVVKTKIDGVKAENAMTLAQVFQGNYPMNVTWVILLVLLGTGILAGLVSTVFSSTPKVSEAISAVGALAFLLGVCFGLLEFA